MDALIIIGMLIFVVVAIFVVMMKISNPLFMNGWLNELFYILKITCGILLPIIFFGLNLYLFIEKINPNSPNIINELNKQYLTFTVIFLVLSLVNLVVLRD